MAISEKEQSITKAFFDLERGFLSQIGAAAETVKSCIDGKPKYSLLTEDGAHNIAEELEQLAVLIRRLGGACHCNCHNKKYLARR